MSKQTKNRSEKEGSKTMKKYAFHHCLCISCCTFRSVLIFLIPAHLSINQHSTYGSSVSSLVQLTFRIALFSRTPAVCAVCESPSTFADQTETAMRKNYRHHKCRRLAIISAFGEISRSMQADFVLSGELFFIPE